MVLRISIPKYLLGYQIFLVTSREVIAACIYYYEKQKNDSAVIRKI